MIIFGDSAEPVIIHKKFKERLGKQYHIQQLGFWNCKDNKIMMRSPENFPYCAMPAEIPYLKAEFSPSDVHIRACEHREYIQVADFTNEIGSWYAERKSVGDFVAAMKARLYTQMNKMDKFIKDGAKIIILEGTPRNKRVVKLNDSKSFFSGVDRKNHDLRGLSPIEQAIVISGQPERVWSFIREATMRGMMFVQTWDMDETIEFIIQMDEGFGHESKHRLIPKQYPSLTIEEAILCQFKGIGLKRSKSILKKDEYITKRIKSIDNYMKKIYKTKERKPKKKKGKKD